MLCIMSLAEAYNVKGESINSINASLVTYMNDFQNESFVGLIISKVKEIFAKIKAVLIKIKNKIFGLFGLTAGFTESEDRTIRSKMNNNYFIRQFKMSTHEWNNRYLNALSDMVKKLDSVRVRLPDGSQIDSAAESIVDAIVDKVDRYNAGRASNIKDVDMKSSYKSAIDSAVSRILNVSDVSDIKSIIRSKSVVTRSFTSRELSFILEDYNNTSNIIKDVSDSYSRLVSKIEDAEHAIGHIQINDNNGYDAYTHMVQDLMYLLQYKIKVINSIEHIHIECLNERATEYRKILRAFIDDV